MTPPITPLDGWAARVLGDAGERPRLRGRAALERFQEEALRRLVRHAAEHAPFYRERLRGFEDAPLHALPFTFPADLAAGEGGFLAVSRAHLRRIVTLASSGTTGEPKRLGFADDDMARTVEFFRAGMRTFTAPGDCVAVCMEGSRPDTIGALLDEALRPLGCDVRSFGFVRCPQEQARALDAFEPRVVVGVPAQMLALARESTYAPQTVLLSGDMAPPALRRRIEARWNCRTFLHYGLTESGWGGAVECEARQGCHVREPEVLFEIVDADGQALPDGAWGEIALTTLSRLAFPLIRYRTGDEGRFLRGECLCGSPLKRLEVRGRLPIVGHCGEPLRLFDVEEALWSFGEIEDFAVDLRRLSDQRIEAEAWLLPGQGKAVDKDAVLAALRSVPGIPGTVEMRCLEEGTGFSPGGKRGWGAGDARRSSSGG